MHLVYTVVLDFEDPLVFYTPLIRGHKTFCLEPYLLLVHVSKFYLDHFSLFSMRVLVGMIPSLD